MLHLCVERFDKTIIEERRLAALELLNFVGSQPHLFNSLTIQEFFAVCDVVQSLSHRVVVSCIRVICSHVTTAYMYY